MTFYINELFNNYIFVASALSWAAAQIIKTILNLFVTKEFNAERLVGAGGMPSAHSSFVSALVVSTGRQCGLGAPEFALAFALACVVIYDAMGVRRAAGEQAKMINLLTDQLIGKSHSEDVVVKQLKELLGHTPIEVIAGCILGITIAFIL
ncbi:MAG: divergent PAP2 family protein [Oscillospiraceae bacterium]|nr:divergent PAP2 family protein [Oscillospiraceae bacterium]